MDPAKRRVDFKAGLGYGDPRVNRSIVRASIRAMVWSGVDVAVLNAETAELGASVGGDAVALAVADLAQPSTDTALLAVHELGHVLFEKQSPERQAQLHRAIDNLSRAGRLSLAAEAQAEVNTGVASKTEEKLVEHTANELMRQGFDPERAASWAQRLVRKIRELWVRSMMALQKALLGAEHVSDTLAVKYFQIRMESMLAGDDPGSFISYLGGPRNLERAAELYTQGDEHATWVDIDGMTRVTDFLPTNLQKALASIRIGGGHAKMRAPVAVSERQPLPPDAPIAQVVAAVDTVAVRHVNAAIVRAHDIALGKTVLAPTVTSDQMAGMWVDRDPKLELPSTIEAGIASELADIPGTTPVDPELRITGGAQSFNNEMTLMRSMAKALGGLRAHRTAANDRFHKETHDRNVAENRLRWIDDKVNRWTEKYQDSDWVNKDVLRSFRDMFGQLKQDVRFIANTAHRSGILLQQARGAVTDMAPEQLIPLVNGTIAKLTGSGTQFFDFLQQVAKLNINWTALPIKDAGQVSGISTRVKLAMGDNPLLKSMNVQQQNATIALVSAWAKENDHAMALLKVRADTNAAEAAKLRDLVKSAIVEASTDMEAAYAQIKSLPRMAMEAQRILDKIKMFKRERSALTKRIESIDAYRAVHKVVLPVFNEEIAILESKLGAAEEFFVVEGALIHVPPTPDATPSIIEQKENARRLKLTGDGQTTSAEWHEIMAKIAAWLQVNRGKGGKLEGKYENMLRVMAMHDLTRAQYGIKQSLVGKWFGSIADAFEFTGTKAGARLAAMVRKYTWLAQTYDRDLIVGGKKVADAKWKAMNALGYKDPKSFNSEFHDAAFDFFNKRWDLQERETPALQREAVLSAFRASLMENPEYQTRLTRQSWEALVKYYDACWEQISKLETTARAMGVKVNDPFLGIQRRAIGDPRFIAPRHVASHMAALVNRMITAGWASTKDERLDEQKMAEAYADGKLEKMLGDRFTHEIWHEFIAPLANRPGRSLFSGARRADGSWSVASVANTKFALETSNGDPIRFAEALAMREGVAEEDMPQFVADTVSTMQSVFDQVFQVIQDSEAGKKWMGDVMSTPHSLMDARISEEWPVEFVEYSRLDDSNARLVVHRMALHAALGRDAGRTGNGFSGVFTEAQNELRDAASRWDELLDAVRRPAMTAQAVEAAAEALAKKRGLNKRDVAFMKNAADNRAVLDRTRDHMSDWFKTQASDMVESRAILEMLSTMAGFMVQGPKSALLQTADMLTGPFIVNGLSRTAIRQTITNWTTFSKEVAGTVFQTLGIQFGANAEHLRMLEEIGMRDQDLDLSLMDWAHGAVGADLDTMGRSGLTARISQAVVKGARLAKISTQVGLKDRTGAGYVTLKPQAPFSMITNWMNRSLVTGVWKSYQTLAAKAVRHMRSNPATAGDPDFKFDAKSLGYSEAEFELMNAALGRWGMTLEGVARAALKDGAPLFTRDQYRALSALANSEISLEAGPATSPRWFGNELVRYAAPLLRWSFAKTGQLQKLFREPSGEASVAAMRTGITTMMLAVVPVGLMYAVMMDWYDRFLTNKKSNVRQFGEDNNVKAFIEQSARLGSFGVWGDVANTVANLGGGGDLRGISADSRVILLNSMLGFMQTMNGLIAQDTADYATIYRPMIASLGGSGYLQYAQIINNSVVGSILNGVPLVGDLLEAEKRVTSRINVSNWLRSVGREMQLDVRQSSGRGGSTPTPTRPYISQMVLAAIAQDSTGFSQAYADALREVARDFPERDPEEYVARAFSSSNPLRTVFRTPPSDSEYMMMLSRLPDDGRQDVATAIELLNVFGDSIGAKPFEGKEESAPKRRTATIGIGSPFGF